MKNVSVRTKILGGVVIVNLLGAMAVVVYLHQTFSSGLDDTAGLMATQSVAAWEQLGGEAAVTDPVASTAKVTTLLEKMKAITGADYGFLLDKQATTKDAYATMREARNLADDWDERETYALLSVTDEAAGDKMQIAATPDSVPESGKLVGVENGACSKTCHTSIQGSGDYWAVRWSTDRKTRGHAVFPVTGAKGEPVGLVYGIQDMSKQADGARTSLLQTLTVVGITLLVATLVIGGIVDSFVFRRLARMTASMEDIGLRVAGGDLNAHYVPDGTSDEIGELQTFFAQLMDLVSSTLKKLSEPGSNGK
jgi:HAMP domain-containing protein